MAKVVSITECEFVNQTKGDYYLSDNNGLQTGFIKELADLFEKYGVASITPQKYRRKKAKIELVNGYLIVESVRFEAKPNNTAPGFISGINK